MASYPPPIANVPEFDTLLFERNDAPLTYSEASKLFLKFPNAQGTENLAAINVNGVATLNNTTTLNGQTTTTKRIQQTLNTGANWNNTTNGYYALAKKTYPLPNPYSAGAEAVSTWTLNPSLPYRNWRGITWAAELGLFVAVSDNTISAGTTRFATSSDGLNWILRVAPSAVNWVSVAWSRSLTRLVAISATGDVAYSSDGITWSNVGVSGVPAGGNWNSIIWSPELSRFVIVGEGGATRTAYSSDGLTWSSGTIDSYNWKDIAWSPELSIFVACGTPAVGYFATSSDGITFNAAYAAPVGSGAYAGITWSPELGLFCAVSNGSTATSLISSDGLNWTLPTTPSGRMTDITWAAELGLFIGVHSAATNRIQTSPDGLVWTARSSVNAYVAVAWSPELGMAFACGTGDATTAGGAFSSLKGRPPTSYNVFENPIMPSRVNQILNSDANWQKSVNGYYALAKKSYPLPNPSSAGAKATSVWTERVAATPTNNWTSVCWSPELGIFVAVASNGTTANQVMTSTDGINWTSSAAIPAVKSWTSVVWAAELSLFVAVSNSGTAGGRVMYSSTGTSGWTATSAATDDQWRSIAWSPELRIFVAVGTSGTGTRAMYSTTGTSGWTTAIGVPDNEWRGVCWSAELGLFCAVASTGLTNRVMTSSDGINWTTQVSPITQSWYGIAWSPELGLFCATAAGGSGTYAMTSPDGINWTTSALSATTLYPSVVWAAELGLFVASSSWNTSSACRFATSSDGITWVVNLTTSFTQCVSICWSPELGICCGVTGLSINATRVWTSSLRGRPPTSFNQNDNRYFKVDENNNWAFGYNTATDLKAVDLGNVGERGTLTMYDTSAPYTNTSTLIKSGNALTITGVNNSSSFIVNNTNSLGVSNNTLTTTTAQTTIDSVNGLSIPTSGITWQDSTAQTSKFIENIVNDCDVLSYLSARTILISTFNIADNVPASLTIGTTTHRFAAVRLIKGQTYTGVGYYTGTGSAVFDFALYNSGATPVRLATASQTASANVMNFVNFASPYTPSSNQIAYIGVRSASVGAAILVSATNTFVNVGYTTMTNSTLSARTQSGASGAAFANPYTGGIVMTAETTIPYFVLY